MRHGTQDRIRTALVLGGIGVTAYGGYLVLSELGTDSILGLGLWLAATIVVHDGVLVPAVTVVGRLLFPRPAGSRTARNGRPTSHRLLTVARPGTTAPGFARSHAAALTRTVLVSACLITVIVLPEIWSQQRGTANPTILPGDYAQNLLGLWIVVLAISAIVLAIGLIVRRRQQ